MERKRNTIIRTTVLAIALLNQILSATGHSVVPVSDEQISEIISAGFTIVAALWSWWKNNSFTKNAILSDKILDSLNKIEEV